MICDTFILYKSTSASHPNKNSYIIIVIQFSVNYHLGNKNYIIITLYKLTIYLTTKDGSVTNYTSGSAEKEKKSHIRSHSYFTYLILSEICIHTSNDKQLIMHMWYSSMKVKSSLNHLQILSGAYLWPTRKGCIKDPDLGISELGLADLWVTDGIEFWSTPPIWLLVVENGAEWCSQLW